MLDPPQQLHPQLPLQLLLGPRVRWQLVASQAFHVQRLFATSSTRLLHAEALAAASISSCNSSQSLQKYAGGVRQKMREGMREQATDPSSSAQRNASLQGAGRLHTATQAWQQAGKQKLLLRVSSMDLALSVTCLLVCVCLSDQAPSPADDRQARLELHHRAPLV